jgi:Flp pilus assembly protein TadG
MRRGRYKSTAGNAALELALTFMLLWTLLGGAFRFGYAMYVYESLVSAVAGAARFASRVDFDSGHTFTTSVKNMAVYGSPTTGTAALAPGLTTANINVTWTTDATGLPLTITVSVTHYTINAVFQTFTWSGKPSMTVRFAGRYLT